MACQPAFNYARDEHGTEIVDAGATFATDDLRLALATARRWSPMAVAWQRPSA
jgi:hypothetical protein